MPFRLQYVRPEVQSFPGFSWKMITLYRLLTSYVVERCNQLLVYTTLTDGVEQDHDAP